MMNTAKKQNNLQRRGRDCARWAAAALLLALALGGCRLPGGEPAQDRAATRAAETITARSGQEDNEEAPTSSPADTPTPSAAPTDTARTTASAGPTDTTRPTASPTPELGLSVRLERLTGFDSLFLEFAVTNQGAVPLESAAVTVTDPGAGNTYPARQRDGFGRVGGEGGGGSEIKSLDPGQSGWAYSSFFESGELPASGQPLEVELRACTGDGLTGSCTVERITITRP
jgi:hypothetical protein